MNLKTGQRVIVTFPSTKPPDAVAEVIGGPLMQKGLVVWEVRMIGEDGADIWVPEGWMKPLFRPVE